MSAPLARTSAPWSADVIHTPPYRGRVRLRARTVAGTEALESLIGREGDGLLYLSKCGTKASIAADVFETFAADLVHDHGIDMEEAWMDSGPAPTVQ